MTCLQDYMKRLELATDKSAASWPTSMHSPWSCPAAMAATAAASGGTFFDDSGAGFGWEAYQARTRRIPCRSSSWRSRITAASIAC